MKLYEYAIELANGIAGTEQTRGHTITITLLPEHIAYRKVIASVIYNQFTSQSAREVLSNVVLEHEALCRALEMSRKENEELLAKIAEFEEKGVKVLPSRVLDNGDLPAELESTESYDNLVLEAEGIKPIPKPKPKRVIQSAPKKGGIEQEALDKAMQGLRKRRADKKAAQKAKKDE